MKLQFLDFKSSCGTDAEGIKVGSSPLLSVLTLVASSWRGTARWENRQQPQGLAEREAKRPEWRVAGVKVGAECCPDQN